MKAVPEVIPEQAAHWLLRLDEGHLDDNERLAFEQWLQTDPRHAQVFEQMQGLWQAAQPAKRKRASRKLMFSASALLILFSFGLQDRWQNWQADYHSAQGEILRIELSDGSTAFLNSDSAIALQFDQTQRRVRLIRGEVFVDVTRDPAARPFVVSSRDAAARALGTRYSVRQRTHDAHVAVYESRVKVSSDRFSQTRILEAGEGLRVSAQGMQLQPGSSRARPDWTDQRLVFRGTPLQDVVERLSEFHPAHLSLSESAAHVDKAFTGVLPADDPDTALSLLASGMGLEITEIGPWYIRLSASSDERSSTPSQN